MGPENNENKSSSIHNPPRVYEAIRLVMQDLGIEGIGKDRQAQGYKFRGIDEVLNALNPLLAKHKLIICPRVLSRDTVERQAKSGSALFYTFVHAEFDFVSSIDGSRLTASTFGEAMDISDKSTNKAMSAAYKYAAFQTFCIPTEAVDSETDTNEVVAAKTAAKTAALNEKLSKPSEFIIPKETQDLISDLSKRIKDCKNENELKLAWADVMAAIRDKKLPLSTFPPHVSEKIIKDLEEIKNLTKTEVSK